MGNKIPYSPQIVPSYFSATWAYVGGRNSAVPCVITKVSSDHAAFYGCVLTYVDDETSIDVQVGGTGRIAGILVNPAGQNPDELFRSKLSHNVDSQGALCTQLGTVVASAVYGEIAIWIHAGMDALGTPVVYDKDSGEIAANVSGPNFIPLPTAKFIKKLERDIDGDGEIDMAILSINGF